ncbi:MAG: DUF6266 family protein [Daejeonella sp.]
MARVLNGINGAFSGMVGSVVGYVRNGQAYMRSRPKDFTKPPTQLQLDNQNALKSAQAWLKSITPFVRVSFKNYSQNQHGFGNALSYNKLNALRANLTLDPALALVSWGDLPVPVSPTVTVGEPGFLEFTWDTDGDRKDHVLLLAKHEGETCICELCGAKRSAGREILDCTNIKGREADIYIAFINEDRSRCSNSVYLGKVMVG